MKESLKSAINPAKILGDIISIESLTKQEKNLADFIEKGLQELPPSWQRGREGNCLWVQSEKKQGQPLIGFVGHLDTVIPLHRNPFRIENEIVFGSGAADMKGGVAVMLSLLEEFKSGYETDFQTLFIFYDCEEGSIVDNGLGPLLKNHPEWKEIDLAICLEPTNNAIEVGCMGNLHATLTFEGESAHSARPWLGKNAIHMAGDFLAKINQRKVVKVEVQGHLFKEVMTITQAQGGDKPNQIPESFKLNLNYRFSPAKSEQEAKQDVVDFVEEMAKIEWRDYASSGKVCLDNQQLQAAISKKKPEIRAKQAWTDVAQLSDFGIDAVNWGPGDPQYAHRMDEQVSIKNLYESLDIMKALLKT